MSNLQVLPGFGKMRSSFELYDAAFVVRFWPHFYEYPFSCYKGRCVPFIFNYGTSL